MPSTPILESQSVRLGWEARANTHLEAKHAKAVGLEQGIVLVEVGWELILHEEMQGRGRLGEMGQCSRPLGHCPHLHRGCNAASGVPGRDVPGWLGTWRNCLPECLRCC